jgi:hypothetical protein
MTPAENLAPLPTDGAASSVEPAAEAGPFVINLCSSSTPMALPRTDMPELSRFNFFVSRRFEEGRERFRLHMGFFATQAEAESWLGVVREVYPGAWAGEAPGRKLRARAVAAAEAQAAQAAGPRPPAPEVEPGIEIELAADVEPTPAPQARPATPVAEASPGVPTLQPPDPAVAPAGESKPRKSAEAKRPVVAAPAPPTGAKLTVTRTAKAPAALSGSNIKEVLAALDRPSVTASAPCPLPMPASTAALSDAQALQCLEGRTAETAKPAAFAVQLQWSVQPISVAKLPPLAIFSAYSLYCVEGSREGRKWFGLRLGFFNDPISAKQVAAYVRSEFVSAAVVPVSAQERQRVSGDSSAIPVPAVAKRRQHADSEFTLFDVDAPVPSATAPVAESPRPKASVRELRPMASQQRSAGSTQVHARERRGPKTLEETLEILGANELTIDEGRDGATAARADALARKSEKSTPFTRLLERLGERVRKN